MNITGIQFANSDNIKMITKGREMAQGWGSGVGVDKMGMIFF